MWYRIDFVWKQGDLAKERFDKACAELFNKLRQSDWDDGEKVSLTAEILETSAYREGLTK